MFWWLGYRYFDTWLCQWTISTVCSITWKYQGLFGRSKKTFLLTTHWCYLWNRLHQPKIWEVKTVISLILAISLISYILIQFCSFLIRCNQPECYLPNGNILIISQWMDWWHSCSFNMFCLALPRWYGKPGTYLVEM